MHATQFAGDGAGGVSKRLHQPHISHVGCPEEEGRGVGVSLAKEGTAFTNNSKTNIRIRRINLLGIKSSVAKDRRIEK